MTETYSKIGEALRITPATVKTEEYTVEQLEGRVNQLTIRVAAAERNLERAQAEKALWESRLQAAKDNGLKTKKEKQLEERAKDTLTRSTEEASSKP